MEIRLHSRVIPHCIFGGQDVTGISSSPSSTAFLVNNHFTINWSKDSGLITGHVSHKSQIITRIKKKYRVSILLGCGDTVTRRHIEDINYCYYYYYYYCAIEFSPGGSRNYTAKKA